jgi:TRAP-type C4-dicarboxylate transport system permease small subunit
MKTIDFLIGVLKIAAGLSLLGMVFLTCADVIGGVFGHPILGSEEIVGLLGTLLLAFALPVTHRGKGHIGVDLLYNLVSDKAKTVTDIGISLTSGLFFLLAAWQSFLYAREIKAVGQVSATIQFPIHYIIYGVFLGCLVLALVIFAELVNLFRGHTDE